MGLERGVGLDLLGRFEEGVFELFYAVVLVGNAGALGSDLGF